MYMSAPHTLEFHVFGAGSERVGTCSRELAHACTGLSHSPGAATALPKVTGVIVMARVPLRAAAGCEAPPP